MAALLITMGQLRKDGAEALERYAAGVIPVLNAAGVEIVTRAQTVEQVVGGVHSRPDLVAVMRFPSAEAIHTFLESKEYAKNIEHRDGAFTWVNSYIAGDL